MANLGMETNRIHGGADRNSGTFPRAQNMQNIAGQMNNPQAPHIRAIRTVAARGTVWETELPVSILQDCKDAGWLSSSWGRVTVTPLGERVSA